MKKTLLSSMIIILMGLLGACSSNTSDNRYRKTKRQPRSQSKSPTRLVKHTMP